MSRPEESTVLGGTRPKLIQAAVLTISDRCSRDEREDTSGPMAASILAKAGMVVKHQSCVPDDYGIIVRTLQNWCKPREELDLIVTTGGTGVSCRDVTPEATMAVLDRLIPGIPEAMRATSLRETPNAMLSRGLAGVKGLTVIVNLPGSPDAVRSGLGTILEALIHAVEIISGKQE